MLDEMFQPNAPKFAILLEYENPYSNDIPFVRGKQTKHEMKNKQKSNVGSRTPKVWQILMCYSLEHSLYMHSTPTKKISKVCYI